MYRDILHTVDRIEIWPIIGLIIFFVFFLIVMIAVIKADKGYTDKMKKLPLDENDQWQDPTHRTIKDAK